MKPSTSPVAHPLTIWVDLANSPQVLVLAPMIRELERRGHEVLVTTRPFAQTVELANQAGLRHAPLGRHGGDSRARAVAVNLERAALLLRHLGRRRVDLAVSHNSFSQAVAARARGIPFVTLYDYEFHRGSHLSFRVARRVLVPDAFPDAALRRLGALPKAVRYPGLKEELYLAGFTPDPRFRAGAGIPADRTLVVMRPPGSWAPYYHGTGALFDAALRHVRADERAFLVFLPRVPAQAAAVRDWPAARVLVPARPLDGPNLLAAADVVISAGGTMNREAAVLSTPVWSAFEGPLAGVDRALIRAGRLHRLRTEADAATIPLIPRTTPFVPPLARPALLPFVTDAILGAGSGRRGT